MRGALLSLSIAVGCIGLVITAQAQPENLRLQDILARVIATNPKLQGQRYALAGADARRDQAALRPVLELGIEVENVLGTGQLRAFKDTEATLRLGTVLELGGKRDRRIDTADRERELIALEKDAERLDILAEAARRFILALAEQERLALAVQDLDLSQRTVDDVKQRVTLGRASPVESSTAKLALAQSEIGVQEQRSQMRAAWASVSATWGGAPDASGQAQGALFDLPVLPPFSTLAQAIEKNPDVVRFATERRVNEAKLRLAEASRDPDVAASVGLRRFQATKDQAVVFAVSVPLGSGGRSAPYEREAQSRIAQGQADEAAARVNLAAALYGLHQQMEGSRGALDKLQSAALPEAVQAERLTEDGFLQGRLSLVELNLARRALLGVRQQAVATAATYHQFYLEIERLTGRSLSDPATKPR
ncbi:MAG: TolC family protein [Rhodospirillaceae bacterium]|nr:TolC family protein [Rhodospirillaceae bacterium]